MSHADIRNIIVGLMLAILLGALDQTIVSVALPRMSEQLHGFDLLAWVVSGYLVASTVVTPIYGKLGDLFGRRMMLSIAIWIFICASALCGAAQSMPELVGARILQGLGGGGLISIAQTIIADVVPLRERGRYQGYISGVFAVSSVAGPVVGGLLTHYFSWRWIFWINLPLGLAAFAVTRHALRHLPVPSLRRPVDYLGALLLTIGLTALLIAITQVGRGVPIDAPRNVGLFGAALIVLCAFAFWQGRAAEPIVPLRLFRLRAVWLCCAVLFLAFFQLIGLSVLMPLRFQMTAGVTADQAAWRLIPLSLMIPFGAFIGGRLTTRTGRYRPIQLTGTAMVPLALAAIALLEPRQAFLTAGAMVIAGLGIGLQFPTSLLAVQNTVPRENIGIATALTAFFRSLGGAIGVAVLSSILLSMLGGGSHSGFSSGDVLHELISQTDLSGTGKAGLRDTAEHAFRTLFLIGAGISVIPVALSFFVPDNPLRGRE